MMGLRDCMRSRAASLALGALLAVASVGGAQQERPAPTDRDALESRFQAALDARLKRDLKLSDAQSTQLRATMGKFEVRRRQLLQDERSTRMALRKELQRGDSASDERVAPMIAGMLELQRRRVALVEDEQQELARFLTPVQRARYLALQENLRRKMQQGARERSNRQDARKRGERPSGERPSGERPTGGDR